MQNENILKWYERMGIEPPTHLPHGVVDTPEQPLSEQLLKINPRNWRMEGNALIADTDFGLLVQFIDPSYVCRGTDENGLPILTKLQL